MQFAGAVIQGAHPANAWRITATYNWAKQSNRVLLFETRTNLESIFMGAGTMGTGDRICLRTMNKVVATVAALVLLLGGALLFNVHRSAAGSIAPHGIVPIGTTNEGGSGAFNHPATGGILDITAGPCSPLTSSKIYESLPSRVTLLRGSTIVAQWEIYGEQRIAWIEPVGRYFIRTNQTPFKKNTSVVITASHNASVDLLPACP
jgi:hypothetical protein